MSAACRIAGCCNRDLFELWLAECLLPQLEVGDVIVIDASFQYSAALEEMVAEAGCEIWSLLAYSPDLGILQK